MPFMVPLAGPASLDFLRQLQKDAAVRRVVNRDVKVAERDEFGAQPIYLGVKCWIQKLCVVRVQFASAQVGADQVPHSA